MIPALPNIGFEKLILPPMEEGRARSAREEREVQEEVPAPESSTKVTLELSDEERRLLDQLAATDRKVRAHEQAHINVGRNLILSGPTYEYETGPDGKNYAVAGEVQIDTSPAKTPEETIPKAQHIRATALAPPDPSPQDQRVAAIASQLENQARSEVALQKSEEQQESAGARAATNTYQSISALGGEPAEQGLYALA